MVDIVKNIAIGLYKDSGRFQLHQLILIADDFNLEMVDFLPKVLATEKNIREI